MVDDNVLLEWNERGLIPGPRESEALFLKRAQYCLQLSQQLPTALSVVMPLESFSHDKGLLAEGYPLTTPLYGIKIDWLPLCFSDQSLHWWHGACACLFQDEEQGCLGAFMQLRRSFSIHADGKGFYSRSEVIAHESAHIGRMAFDDNRFEEILAYRSSSRWWRRFLGPIVESPGEALIFVATLAITATTDLLALFFGSEETFLFVQWVKLVPLFLLLFAFGRLLWRHKLFRDCYSNVLATTGTEAAANAVIYRLTDKEIARFAASTPEEIKAYAIASKENSLRWKVIALAYFQSSFP